MTLTDTRMIQHFLLPMSGYMHCRAVVDADTVPIGPRVTELELAGYFNEISSGQRFNVLVGVQDMPMTTFFGAQRGFPCVADCLVMIGTQDPEVYEESAADLPDDMLTYGPSTLAWISSVIPNGNAILIMWGQTTLVTITSNSVQHHLPLPAEVPIMH